MNTILIGTPKIINSFGIKEKKIVNAPWELSIEIYNDKKIGKNNNVIIFNADQNLVKTRVGLKWIYNKFPNINDIINIAEIVPINEMILKTFLGWHRFVFLILKVKQRAIVQIIYGFNLI